MKAVLLDLGGTVLAENSYDIVRGFESIKPYIQDHQTASDLLGEIDLQQRNNAEFSVLDWISTHLQTADHDIQADTVEATLWDNTVNLSPLDGVENTLSFLRSNSIRVAALSNAIFSADCINRELEKHGLAQYFEFVISSADLGFRKPDTATFAACLERLGLSNYEICYIGDNWQADIIGADTVDILPIYFGQHTENADTKVPHQKLLNWNEFFNLWTKISAK